MVQLRTQYSTQVKMMLEQINNFLFDAGGTTVTAFSNAVDSEKKLSHAFFKPYKDPSDFCIRAATIVSAPIACAILAVESLGFAIFFAIKSLCELCMLDTSKASESIGSFGESLLGIFAAVIAAFISPLVNFIDLIGGGVVTAKEQYDEQALFEEEFLI